MTPAELELERRMAQLDLDAAERANRDAESRVQDAQDVADETMQAVIAARRRVAELKP